VILQTTSRKEGYVGCVNAFSGPALSV
jgi:hypothetical protein